MLITSTGLGLLLSFGEAFDGRFGIYVEELNSGASYGYCDNERFPPASAR